MYPENHYTLVFDIYNPKRLVEDKRYIDCLIGKKIDICEIEIDNWVSKILETGDIFTSYNLQSNNSVSINQSGIKELIEVFKQNLKLGTPYLVKGIDYRFTKLEIIPVDMDSENFQLRAKFLGLGVIRLFRNHENEEDLRKENKVEGDDTMVAIVAVPTYFTATDLLGFLGEDTKKNVSHFRLLRSNQPNRFMVLMKFRNNEFAKDFKEKFNGKSFNSMEPETCQVIFVKKILFIKQTNKNNNNNNNNNNKNTYSGSISSETETETEISSYNNNNIPYLLDDPFTSPPTSSTSLKPKPPPTPTLTELPTCPVCLERMDASITGLLTIPCQHTFHCQCLSRWKDDTCPVCRYSNKLERTQNLINKKFAENCSICSTTNNLWACLICGNVGCGRYDSGHAIHHYHDTDHCFAMNLDSQRVWDYAGDNYVHRLLRNETDGKLVELPARDEKHKKNNNNNSNNNNNGSGGTTPGDGHDATSDDKVDKVGFEYSQLLIQQAESQRDYYESKINELSDRLSKYQEAQQEEESLRRKKEAEERDFQFNELNLKLEALSIDLPDLKNQLAQAEKKLAKALKENESNLYYKELNFWNWKLQN
ncbi:hypothetical protein PACTADRAFT_85579 [Pachysolen tannophilus NRRL Y-2460]|uniref:Uncharacterized protein n=1 Tax=Pachysolen tannophilus NRRL Y-2460 TaxID=669874 RepID=A0A1E4TUS7_PACTA|nr:hypothetical protein PACTADRAFT_85579 [Pachysolen tannophilus NRRL Y-2460]